MLRHVMGSNSLLGDPAIFLLGDLSMEIARRAQVAHPPAALPVTARRHSAVRTRALLIEPRRPEILPFCAPSCRLAAPLPVAL